VANLRYIKKEQKADIKK